MAKQLVSDALWQRIQPILPEPKPRRQRYPGRKPIDDRKALAGILFVLKTGINWEDLPQEMGCGSGMTCWRRVRDWSRAGVWPQIREMLLEELAAHRRRAVSRDAIRTNPIRSRRREPSPSLAGGDGVDRRPDAIFSLMNPGSAAATMTRSRVDAKSPAQA